MKKLGLTTAFLAILLSVVSDQVFFSDTLPAVTAFEEDFEKEQITYNDMTFIPRTGKNNELMLFHYDGTESNLIVPEKIEGYTVTGISNFAFANNKVDSGINIVIENVTLPDTINYFGKNVFNNSTVVSINIPKNLRLIPSSTFQYCKNLETVVFHDDIIAIANSAFKNTNITFPQNLQNRISADSPLSQDNSKSHYTSQNETFTFSVDTDEDTDSLYCSVTKYKGNDPEIILPESIYGVPVKSYSFANLDKPAITSVIFPETAADFSVETNALSNSAISELNINSPCTLRISSFESCKALKTAVFKDDIKIDIRAFKDCTSLTSVEFGGKADLNKYSFLGCYSIENITLDTSQTINGNAFNNCTSLMNINSQPVFDSATGDFIPEYSDFIRNSFYMAEDIGFLNEYAKAQYKKIADEVTTPNMSDIEKIKVLHDWVCENTRYADNTTLPEYYTDASILLNDSTVCEGYAKAFNLLCHSVGIETYYVSNSSHAWNIVKIGGHYFHIDSTWDDGDNISHSWFLKSDDEIKDNNSHSKWKSSVPTLLHSFQKNVTPECKYQIADVNTDGEVSIADLVKTSRYLLGAETETTDNIVLYDLNFDGNADVFDMILMRKKLIGNRN